MHLLRSRIFALLVAALVFAGYAAVLYDACCHDDSPTPTALATAGVSGNANDAQPDADHGDGGICHCNCHPVLTLERVAAFRPVALMVLAEVPERSGTLPDTIPSGIKYPPRRA